MLTLTCLTYLDASRHGPADTDIHRLQPGNPALLIGDGDAVRCRNDEMKPFPKLIAIRRTHSNQPLMFATEGLSDAIGSIFELESQH